MCLMETKIEVHGLILFLDETLSYKIRSTYNTRYSNVFYAVGVNDGISNNLISKSPVFF